MNIEIIWEIIDKYFNDNPYALVSHHQDSYNEFFKNGVKQIFKECNPIKILKQQDEQTKEFNLECNLYLGGKEGNKLYYGKPMIYDDNQVNYMFPNHARLRNMTYGFTIHYDIEVDFKIIDTETTTHSITLEKIFLGRFPIMLQSELCVLNNLEPKVRFEAGESINDQGGYFIIDGKEKVLICQEKFGDNMLYIRDNYSDMYNYSIEVRSKSEDVSKPKRTTAVRMVTPLPTQSNKQLVVVIPNVRKPVPLFIAMRALGILSDKEIIEVCLLDMEKHKSYVDLFIPSIHDANVIFTQETALKYIATFTKGKTIPHVLEILSDYFLPHIGETNFREKAYYIGYMAFSLLRTYRKEQAITDRDNFKYKRIEDCGSLLYDLFKEYYQIMQHKIYQRFDKEYYYHEGQYQGVGFINLIENNYKEFFKERDVEIGFKKAFKGNWGAEAHTKRPGVIQDLNRLSYNSALSQRRKINLPLDASAKVIGPRLLHSSQWGIIDPLDTPDGGNVGLHKHMSIMAKITTGYSPEKLIKLLRSEGYLRYLSECKPDYIAEATKVFINGSWKGVSSDPIGMTEQFKLYRRIALIPIYTSYAWDKQNNIIEIFTDAGRLCRPIFYLEEDKRLSLTNLLEKENYTWEQLITGFLTKKDTDFKSSENRVYSLEELYGIKKIEGDNEIALNKNKAIIEYIDSSEENVAYISSTMKESFENTDYTNVDIHPSLLLGAIGNQIIYPENNQLPRNLFFCGQTKQAASCYHTNYQNRIDKTGIVLNYGQIPLVKSRYLDYVNKEFQPYGENPIVAIMCYGGYNVEDSILFNEGSVKRGMFRTTYLNSYEAHEEAANVGGGVVDSVFTDIQNENVVGTKPGFNYSHLNKYGLIEENTPLDDKMAVIGKATIDVEDPSIKIDASVYPKKGQLGFVDKSFMTEGEEGRRIAKVRIREERIPAVGDKFCSRCGQKGTVGLIIPEENMPFTANGIKPDLIVNPHAFPSRMTIGQLVEVLTGKAALNYGAFGDCTAFVNQGPKNEIFGRLLTEVGYNKTGNELLYNGMTGEQLEADIFIGPTYYMRLKHMVKDKINYRAQGPRTMLTRQTVQGRANDGGLRIGEMERDGVIAHGASRFLQESMMTRGDEYFMAVCNTTGTIAIYNESKNLFLSPMVDGPIKFDGTIDDKLSIVNVSRFGRDFSVVKVPYSFKLLMQELATMNIQMRVITEANVDQLTNMSYSNNINIILNDETITPKELQTKNEELRVDGEEKAPPRGYGTVAPPRGYGTVSPPRGYGTVAPPRGYGDVPTSRGYGAVPPPTAYGENIYVEDVDFIVGDEVLFTNDTSPTRLWKITSLNDTTGEYVISTREELFNLPSFALLSSDGTSASVMANKLQISKPSTSPVYRKPTGYGYGYGYGPSTPPEGPRSPPYNPTTTQAGPRSPPYNPTTPPEGPRSPPYNPTNPSAGPRSPEYNPTNPSAGPRSPEYNPTNPSAGPTSPEYNPTTTQAGPRSPEYNPTNPSAGPTSPEYNPTTTQAGPMSPEYNPTNPSAGPTSPEYNPTNPSAGPMSPEYNPTTTQAGPTSPDPILGSRTPTPLEDDLENTPEVGYKRPSSPDYGPPREGESDEDWRKRTGLTETGIKTPESPDYGPPREGESDEDWRKRTGLAGGGKNEVTILTDIQDTIVPERESENPANEKTIKLN